MKQAVLFLFFLSINFLLFAQQPDTGLTLRDSLQISQDSSIPRKDSLTSKADSPGIANTSGTLFVSKDSIDEAEKEKDAYTTSFNKILKDNSYLNWNATPVAMASQPRKAVRQDHLFYLLVIITAILGFLRYFYTRYFNNLFRVFFNASLRQSQLTDQLLQAKLPSLFFNILFVLTGGVYVYLLLGYYKWILPGNFWLVVLYCGLSLGLIYFGKFLSLKFTGWLTGYREITNTYVFIIFLINKILGITLLPFVILIAFSTPALITAAVIISLLLISLMFLLRFFRSYGLLQHQLKISRFHFFMYVVGVEIIPLLLIYKALVLLLSKNP